MVHYPEHPIDKDSLDLIKSKINKFLTQICSPLYLYFWILLDWLWCLYIGLNFAMGCGFICIFFIVIKLIYLLQKERYMKVWDYSGTFFVVGANISWLFKDILEDDATERQADSALYSIIDKSIMFLFGIGFILNISYCVTCFYGYALKHDSKLAEGKRWWNWVPSKPRLFDKLDALFDVLGTFLDILWFLEFSLLYCVTSIVSIVVFAEYLRQRRAAKSKFAVMFQSTICFLWNLANALWANGELLFEKFSITEEDSNGDDVQWPTRPVDRVFWFRYGGNCVFFTIFVFTIIYYGTSIIYKRVRTTGSSHNLLLTRDISLF